MSLPSEKKRKIFDGRYEVLSIVGRGAESVVYHAKHLTGSQHEVALKVLINNKAKEKTKTSLTERLRKEALTLVSCRHKYVVRLDDFHSVSDLCYLSMEYAALGDLRKYLSSTGKPLSAEMGTTFLRQSLEAMEFIHATGVLHRDVKPDNILLISESEIRLADFGLALLPGDELDLAELQTGVGSLAYLPPELLDGLFYDTRSDLYSLGVCFYEALTGTHPFEHAPLSEQKNVRLDENIKPVHEINPQVPRHISAVITTLMRYAADQRFQTPMEALRAIANPEFTAKPAVASSPAVTSASVDSPSSSAQTPANSDEPDTDFSEEFDDFFGIDDDTDQLISKEQVTSPEASVHTPSEDINTQGDQKPTSFDAAPAPTSLAARAYQSAATEETLRSDGTSSLSKPTSKSRQESKRSPRALPLKGSLPRRILGVAAGAAALTVALAVISHLKPAQMITESTKALISHHDADQETQPELETDTEFPRIPKGTYAGTVQGILPGVTSPLALISRPKENALVVVIGIEGWTPSTVSTRPEKGDPSATVVVRSNGVLLNMTGATSPEEVTGTFVNAVTGESGVWSVRKVS